MRKENIFFTYPGGLKKYLKTIRKDVNKIGFVLQLGYFRAVKRSFAPSKYHKRDLEYVANKLEIPVQEMDLNEYNRSDSSKNKTVILENLGFQIFNDGEKKITRRKS